MLTRLRSEGEDLPHQRPLLTPVRDDDQLSAVVLAAQAGHEEAFSELYQVVQPGLLRYLSVLVGRDAEDIASETWLQVCRDLHTFAGDADGFRGWVITIGRHRGLDHIRSRSRRPADPTSWEALLTVAGRDDTAVQAEESLSTAAALNLIGELPQEQAEAVLLRAVIGLDAKSAAAVLGKSPGAVRTSAYRGLKNLAVRLEQDRAD
ncbi:MAG TPA: RNA polymerase sigma factor [Jatrophihabitans sp.]|jgi:RNA polymerase sigma-70 factor (ECF subfamily)|uniref:RNA polymerase sigma factor n=1 Tax=Jatrophihabitans sp. TaxID=1932789 RepID=UPI002F09C83D